MRFEDSNMKLLEKLVDVSAIKHKVIANNIANVNTPGYKKMEVSFEDELKAALSNTSAKDVSSIRPKVQVAKAGLNSAMRNDGNAVNMENEVADLVKNSLSYNIYMQFLAKRFAGLKSAIGGGRSI